MNLLVFQVVFNVLIFIKSTEQFSLMPESWSSLRSPEKMGPISSQEDSAFQSIRPGVEGFAAELYSCIAKKEGSVIMSPMSLEMVLALALEGALGATATELATALSLLEFADGTRLLGYKYLIRVCQDPVLNLATRFFVEKSVLIKEKYQKVSQEYFSSTAESLDFKEKSEESRNHINAWVEEKTNDKIKDLLPAGIINSDTRLVIVNAIYFKANWKTKFDESKTKEQSFYLSSSKEVNVQMMNVKNKFHFFYDSLLRAKCLRLDYEGEKFEMIILLPDDYNGLTALESKLENTTVSELASKTKSGTVDVSLPKFKMEMMIEMNDVLKSMGIQTMFSEYANFGKMTNEPLVVSSVLQKVFVEVNEKGTEAAAATAMVMIGLTSANFEIPFEEKFVADHPFMFMIRLKEQRIPLFCGRYCGPE